MIVVAVVVAMMLVIASSPAFARLKFGGVQVPPAACELLADGTTNFAWRSGEAVCWFTP